MSADNYANHILQKYRIGTAIAILRSKPEGIPTENYISSLQEKITMARNDLDTNDDDSDVCSNDFQFSDDENMVGVEQYDITLSNIDDLDKNNVEIGNNNADFACSHNRNHKNDTNIDFQNDNDPIRSIENNYTCLDNAINKDLHNSQIDMRVIENNTKTDGLKITDVHPSKDIMAHITTDVDPIIDTMTVDDKLLLNNNDDVLSMNDSITILENIDVNMAEERQSLTEVLTVLKDINQNKTVKDFVDLTQSQIESAQINNRNNEYKPKEDNIKNKSVQNIAKRIRKNIEKDNSSKFKNKTFSYIDKINESIVSKDAVRYDAKDAHKTAENMKEIDKTSFVNDDTIKFFDNNDKYFNKNLLESNLMTKTSRDGIAAKVLKNINTNIKTNTEIQDPVKEIIKEPINKTTTGSINNIVTSTANTFVKRMKTQTDFDVTDSNDPEPNYQNQLFKTQNYNQNDVIANKILNNINKQNFKDNNYIENNNLSTNKNVLDNNKDSQDTLLYSLQGFTQNYTHVSQSQTEEIIISDKFIHGNKATAKFEENVLHDKRLTYSEVNIPHEEHFRTYMDGPNTDLNIQNPRTNSKTYNSNIEGNVNAFNIQYTIDKDGKMFKVLTGNADKINTGFEINETTGISNNNANNIFDKGIENTTATQEINNFDDIFGNPSQMLNEKFKQTDLKKNLEIQKEFIEKSDKEFTDTQLRTKNLAPNEDLTQNSDITTQNLIRNDSLTQNTDSEDERDDHQEDVIPFKVLEEFNKVKVFLNKTSMSTDGYTTDSGYRSSDSQSRSSYKSAFQLSGNWLNQSAHCIYSFIIECPLLANTEEICNEISVVLGKLIDKLHDEEMYPSFIEELFETINCFLQDLHEGGNDCDSMLQKKDENIRRLLLLNRSRHLLNYTIEKIIQILQDTHKSVTTEETYEIDNIAKIENLSYVFFVLENLIQRHSRIKHSENSYSQNTQNTQSQNEEYSLKRSSLTEIWKKKWNPSLKCSKKKDVCMENDCMVILGEVLNKLIVDCMDGYSLIAFAALQCFNMLQN